MLSLNELDPIGLEGIPAEELDSPATPQTIALHELWLSKREGELLPSRSDFSPADMKDYLEHIYIIESIDEGRDFMVRLAGTAHTGLFGDDFTGARFSDERLKKAAWRLKVFRSAYHRLQPVCFRFLLGPSDRPRMLTENLILPVRDQKDDRIILLCVSIVVGELDIHGQLVPSSHVHAG